LGSEVDRGCFGEGGFFLLAAFSLQGAEFSEFLFATAEETGFLQVEVAEFLLVDLRRVKVDFRGIGGLSLKLFGKFAATQGEDGLFERADTAQTPPAIDDGLEEVAFDDADGFVLILVSLDVVLIFDGVVGGHKDGAAGECGFDGVQR